ncbi:phytoene desaturase [Rhodocytophaga rosea]|uniref:Phytoene desaturase n=1 Tax=Rhodocytophaga rosea TaxID=2704465 RepID=A0A6C0GUX2_9BACT|nr:1-hydroxycarotenoid 3,4-desaturase CrtD [Rhodocytophaga rosea]QHT72025.1 phytoene desaturase [Rhodocytophaga rosea]
MTRKAAVIGAGIAGIATAIRLQTKGFQVTVFETNSYPGGKLSAFEQQGYRFDAGPSLFTMPHLVDELFVLAGRNPKDYFEYIRLPVVCEYFYEDGLHIRAHSEPEKFAEEIDRKTRDSKESIIDFLQDSQEKYKITADVFLHRSLHRISTYFNPQAVKGYLNFGKLDVFRTMDQANSARFKDPHTVQLFNRYATYNGSDPYQTPATMNIIPHLEYNIGAYFPKQGMYGITRSLVKLAEEIGVSFQYQSRVEQIMVENDRIAGLKVNDTIHPFHTIVSNMDVVNTYQKLLPDVKQPKRILSQPKSSSALIFYWGIKQSFPQLDLHNIFFSSDYKKEFTCLFQEKTISDDPTVYINISSKYKPDDAPPGGENWFVMINVPNNSGQNWDLLIQQARQHILRKLSRMLHTDMAALIECESVLEPRTIESRTSSWQGALYGNSSNNRYAAFLRHANFSSGIKNLYFCGGSVHPGGGIPLCLLSAKITANLVE